MTSRCMAFCAVGYVLTFSALMSAWSAEEAMEPGRQYGDLLLPCMFLAIFGALTALALERMTRERP